MLLALFEAFGPLRVYILAAVVLYIRAAMVYRLNLFFVFLVPGDAHQKQDRANGIMFVLKWIGVIVFLHFFWYWPYFMFCALNIFPREWDMFMPQDPAWIQSLPHMH